MEITIRRPKLTTMLQCWRWGLLVLLVLAVTLTSGHRGAEPALAQIDITGEWNLKFIGGTVFPIFPPHFSCSYQFTQEGTSLTAVDPQCKTPLTGTIDPESGSFSAFLSNICGGFIITGTVTGGGTAMSGSWAALDMCMSLSDNGTFTGAIKGLGVGGIAELPEAARAPLETGGSSHTNAAVLGSVAAGVLAGVASMGGVGLVREAAPPVGRGYAPKPRPTNPGTAVVR